MSSYTVGNNRFELIWGNEQATGRFVAVFDKRINVEEPVVFLCDEEKNFTPEAAAEAAREYGLIVKFEASLAEHPEEGFQLDD